MFFVLPVLIKFIDDLALNIVPIQAVVSALVLEPIADYLDHYGQGP
jgi:hypothetical protein